MKANLTHQFDASPEQLAQALLGASPEEFALFWDALHHDMEERYGLYAETLRMAEAMGADRYRDARRALRELVRHIDYLEVKARQDRENMG